MFCLADRGRGKNTWDTLYQFIHEAFANTDILIIAAMYFEIRRPEVLSPEAAYSEFMICIPERDSRSF